MKYILNAMLLFVATATVTTVSAQEAEQEVVATPETSGGEQDVTIHDKGTTLIEEYRASGRTYMIRVIPRKGLPYYLIDADGDGSFETRRNQLAPNLLIPSWVIFSW